MHVFCFFFNDTATTEIYTLSLHDALPISFHRNAMPWSTMSSHPGRPRRLPITKQCTMRAVAWIWRGAPRSEEHTSELQSRQYLVCRLLLEKKKKKTKLY